MRQIASHRVWLGHAGDGQDHQKVFAAGIQALVQVAAEEPALDSPRDLVYCRFPIVDGSGNDKKVVKLAINTVATLLEMNVPTLVVCAGGMSRSPAVVAAALSMVFQEALDECLRQITEHCPADVAPALWSEVKLIVEEQVVR